MRLYWEFEINQFDSKACRQKSKVKVLVHSNRQGDIWDTLAPSELKRTFSSNLGVGFSTVRTDVGLDMLRLLVLGNMFQQSSFISEAFVAALTFVRFVCLMTSAVRLEVRQLREGLGATWKQKPNEKVWFLVQPFLLVGLKIESDLFVCTINSPGILHLYGLSPVWVLMCCWRWESWVNFLWQISHL